MARELQPMAAAVGQEVPREGSWVFEPKYDGVRVLAHVTAGRIRLVTRNGKDKARQFPEVVEALGELAGKAGGRLVLDGEVVALERGRPARFQALQKRVHLESPEGIAENAKEHPAAFIAFDLLEEGGESLLGEPWTVRRERLEKLLRGRTSEQLRLSEILAREGEESLEKAREAGWEGVIAKRTDSRYRPGERSNEWLKLKLEYRQEFVVGGWTEPRKTRRYLGALLLGYFDERGRLVYAGHVGGGFSHEALEEMHRRLAPLERKTSPFVETPKTNTPAHWVRPELVVEVKFSEWTEEGKLRQPIYLGIRDDKDPRDVTREAVSVQRRAA